MPCLLCLSNFFHSFNEDKKIYADAQETCEKAALNGFKTGRLVEPKTKSFNDKVYAETNIVFGQRQNTWIGIRAKGGSWVYTSSGIELEFQNWDPQNWGLGQANNDAHDCVLLVWSHPKGQIISKFLFGVFNFFQKRTKTHRIVV